MWKHLMTKKTQVSVYAQYVVPYIKFMTVQVLQNYIKIEFK